MEVLAHTAQDVAAWAVDMYDYWMSFADPRTTDWLLMSSPWPTLSLTALYFVVIFGGQRVMKNREPIEFKKLKQVYNLFLIGLNAYIFYEMVVPAYNEGYGVCDPVNRDPNNVMSLRLAKACWWYYFSKLIEFLDTIFFMLAKKNRNISLLHVYHHSTMFPLWWIGVKFAPGGQSYFGASCNSFIHVVMYFYYFLAALGPSWRKYLWWKRYLTTLQLIQFVVVLSNTVCATYLVRTGQCVFFEWMGWTLIGYSISMLVLFSLFYQQEYTDRPEKKKDGASNGAAINANRSSASKANGSHSDDSTSTTTATTTTAAAASETASSTAVQASVATRSSPRHRIKAST